MKIGSEQISHSKLHVLTAQVWKCCTQFINLRKFMTGYITGPTTFWPTSMQEGTLIYLQSLQNQYKINIICDENIMKIKDMTDIG
jgi:hypothetical protein